MDSSTIFERPFPFDAYMEERLLSIEHLEERAFARQFLTEGLRQIMRESERSYKALEERVYAEIPPMHDKHFIYMTVVEREQYDITNGAWYPVLQDDEITKQDEKEKIETTNGTVVDGVFFRGDGMLVNQIVEAGAFEGTVQTKAGTYPATFTLTPALRYTDRVAYLYELFQQNGLRWNTINCGYLFRFFDVQLLNVEGLETKEEIIDYTVSFGQFAGELFKNRMPVWNVQKIYYNSQQFVIPIIDAKYYEHKFPAEVFGAEHGYLLETNHAILSLRHTEADIVLIASEETFQKWVAYQIIYQPPTSLGIFKFPVMHNAIKENFIARYMERNASVLQSKEEVIRQVEQYDLMGLIKLQDVTLMRDAVDPFHPAHMSVAGAERASEENESYLSLRHLNWFVQDDWIDRNEQKVLLLHFTSRKQDVLQYELISFLLSQLQRQFSEYRCEAVLHLEAGAL